MEGKSEHGLLQSEIRNVYSILLNDGSLIFAGFLSFDYIPFDFQQ